MFLGSARAAEDFRYTLQKFIGLYGFISQIHTFEDVDLEKLYVFAKALNRKLPRRQVRLPYEIREGVVLDSFRLQETYSGSLELEKEQGVVPGWSEGSLCNTEDEKVDIQRICNKLEADISLYAAANSVEMNEKYNNLQRGMYSLSNNWAVSSLPSCLSLFNA